MCVQGTFTDSFGGTFTGAFSGDPKAPEYKTGTFVTPAGALVVAVS